MGRVGSSPLRKKARRNSSKEAVKERRRLDMTPGKTSGKVTRQNVIHPLSPRSREASSKLRSNPSKRDSRTITENGRQTSRWLAPTVQRESGRSKVFRTVV